MLFFHYTYKQYPNAPRTTSKSAALGVLTSFVAMVLWSFFFFGIVGAILPSFGLSEDTAYTMAAILVVPFVYLVRKWKKQLVQKLDAAALVEAARLTAMTEEEKAQMELQRRKKGNKLAVYLWGGIILVFYILIKCAQ